MRAVDGNIMVEPTRGLAQSEAPWSAEDEVAEWVRIDMHTRGEGNFE